MAKQFTLDAEARKACHDLLEQALDGETISINHEVGMREIGFDEYLRDGKPVPTSIERELTGFHTLTIRWYQAPKGKDGA